MFQSATELRKPCMAARQSTAHVPARKITKSQPHTNKRRKCQVGKCMNLHDSCLHCKNMVYSSCTSCIEPRNICINYDADDDDVDDDEEDRSMGRKGEGRI